MHIDIKDCDWYGSLVKQMDIIRKIKPIKASFESLSLHYRAGLIAVLISLSGLLVPHETFAASMVTEPEPEFFVFMAGDHVEFLEQVKLEAQEKYDEGLRIKNLQKKIYLTENLRTYLQNYNSPLAEYAHVLVELKNWKKIIALSNAESTMCRRYPVSTANCWGVGGANMWDMGDNLGEGVKSMDHFLRNYPTRSKVKYDLMPFEHMNGFYKQPAADHWVVNNKVIYDELVELEQEVNEKFN